MRRPLIGLLLAASIAPTAQALAKAAATPAYVAQAERNYRRAQAALNASESALLRLQRQEARQGRRAMRLRGQWIEPSTLWQAEWAARRRLVFAQQAANQSLLELNEARDAARRSRVGPLSRPEPLSTPFWWF